MAEVTKCDIIGHFDLITKFIEQDPCFDVRHPRYVKAWQAAGGNVSRLANLLNVSRVTLYRYLKKYGLEKK